MNTQPSILKENIRNITASGEYYHMCDVNGFNTLEDIAKLPAHVLVKKPEFTLRMLRETYQIFESLKLEGLLKE